MYRFVAYPWILRLYMRENFMLIYCDLFGEKLTFALVARSTTKGQVKSECIYEIIDFPKYHRKNLIDFCPESLFRLGMLCTR